MNNKENLEKFDAKFDEGIFIGYSTTSKSFRVFNKRNLVVEEFIHVLFDESPLKAVRDEVEEGEILELNKNGSESMLLQSENQNVEEIISSDDLNENKDLSKEWKFIHYPIDQIIREPSERVRTRSTLQNLADHLAFYLKYNLKISRRLT